MIELPTTCFAEDDGSLVNSGRWLQWHWAGGTPPGEAKHDAWIMAQIYLRLKALYQKEGGPVPEPIVNLDWRYKDPNEPSPEEMAKELNGAAVEDITDPNDPTKVVLAKGKQLAGLRGNARRRQDQRRHAGSIPAAITEAGNQMARRDNSDPDETGAYSKWAWSWPANRRILYNRASADINGKAWDPTRKLIEWDGVEMGRLRRARHRAHHEARRRRSLHHEPGRFCAAVQPGHDARRSVPGALRAVRIAGRKRDRAEGSRQSRGPRVQGRHGAVRRRQGVPVRGDLLSSHRALPLLDQARPGQRCHCSPNSSWRFQSNWRRRRASSPAAGSGCGPSAGRSRPRPSSPSGSSR